MKRKQAIRLVCTALLPALLLTVPVSGEEGPYFPACSGSEVSLVDALKGAGADAAFSARTAIAAANGLEVYSGTARENIRLLDLMKEGRLRRPEAAGPGPMADNLDKVKYIRQGTKTCKATSVAMAANLLLGKDTYTTKSMGASLCRSIEGEAFVGSDGVTYQGVYKTDRYVGTLRELRNAIDAALEAGLPIVAAVHSTRQGGTKHHWVLIIGRNGEDYLMADPSWGQAGSISENAAALSSRHYALGLTDYDTPHYGYVTFKAS